MNVSRRNTNRYDEQYSAWRNWATGPGFSGLRASYKSDYDAEISRTGLAHINDVIEIGFGNGEFLAYGQSKKWNIIGSELNSGLLERARKDGFKVLAAEEFSSLPNSSFDLIVAFDIFEHIPLDNIEGFLLALKEKLREGGVVLARFPNGDSPLGLPYQNGDPTHVSAYGVGRIRYYAQTCGYELRFVGGQAQPIFCGEIKQFIYRLAVVPVKALLEATLKILFFPKSKITFFSPNLIAVLRKSSA